MTPRQALLECGAADAGSVGWEQAAQYIGTDQQRRCREAVPGLASVHAAVFPYYAGDEPGNLCLYARGEDYHRVLRRRLERAAQALQERYPDCAFAPFADVSPFPEVLLGALCGLGARGQNAEEGNLARFRQALQRGTAVVQFLLVHIKFNIHKHNSHFVKVHNPLYYSG